MKAVVFGPGRIGCGFVGQLLRAAGYDLVFVGRGPIVDHLARLGRYRVRLTDGRTTTREIEIAGVARSTPPTSRRSPARSRKRTWWPSR
jgi:ketopantoate reductase